MFIEMVLNEYKRIMALQGGFFGSRDAELKMFNSKLHTMLTAGTISKSEYNDIQAGIDAIDRIALEGQLKNLATAYRKAFK